MFDRLFAVEAPRKATEDDDFAFLKDLNPKSLEVLGNAKLEPSLGQAKPGERFQFERLGYFTVDLEARPGAQVFNRTVALKDAWVKEKEVAAPPPPKAAKEKKLEAPPAAPPSEIEFGDFTKVSMKAGRVLAAEKVEKTDKLLKLSVDLGEGAPRTIVSGIAEAFTPDQLIGKNVVVVVNLKPRALKGIESRGMILAAGSGKSLQLINPGEVPPGSDVK